MTEEEMLNDIERRFNAGLPLSREDVTCLMEALHRLVDTLVQDRVIKTLEGSSVRKDKTITHQAQVIDTKLLTKRI